MVDRGGRYDEVIVDAARPDSAAFRALMSVSDLLLVPIGPSTVELDSLEKVRERVKSASQAMREAIPTSLIPFRVPAQLVETDREDDVESLTDWTAALPNGLALAELPRERRSTAAEAGLEALYQELYGPDPIPRGPLDALYDAIKHGADPNERASAARSAAAAVEPAKTGQAAESGYPWQTTEIEILRNQRMQRTTQVPLPEDYHRAALWMAEKPADPLETPAHELLRAGGSGADPRRGRSAAGLAGRQAGIQITAAGCTIGRGRASKDAIHMPTNPATPPRPMPINSVTVTPHSSAPWLYCRTA